jgi:Protein of unknown function (DUF3237)
MQIEIAPSTAMLSLLLVVPYAAAESDPGMDWPVPNAEPPATELVLEAYVTIAPAVVVGPSDHGQRQFVPITGGHFVGAGIKGEVMAGGADWQLIRSDGVLELTAIYSLRTDDGAVVVVENRGIGVPADTGTPDVRYLRTSPRFHAPAGPYE